MKEIKQGSTIVITKDTESHDYGKHNIPLGTVLEVDRVLDWGSHRYVVGYNGDWCYLSRNEIEPYVEPSADSQQTFVQNVYTVENISKDKPKHTFGALSVDLQSAVNHPQHYGGDTTYEVIKVIEAWELDNNFCLGNVIKYISRAGKKNEDKTLEDLKKAKWYLEREISKLEKE